MASCACAGVELACLAIALIAPLQVRPGDRGAVCFAGRSRAGRSRNRRFAIGRRVESLLLPCLLLPTQFARVPWMRACARAPRVRACLRVPAHARSRPIARLSQPTLRRGAWQIRDTRFAAEITRRNSRRLRRVRQVSSSDCEMILRDVAKFYSRSFGYYRACVPANCDFRGGEIRELPRRVETRKVLCRGESRGRRSRP